jgi:hypothetical protein
MRSANHYLVDPVACTPASSWEKGQAEEMNAWLLDNCIADAKAHPHPELAGQTI